MAKKRVRFGRIFLLIIVIAVVILLIPKKRLAATVNGEEIEIKLLEEYHDRLPEQYKMFFTKEQLLDQLITEMLLLQQADA